MNVISGHAPSHIRQAFLDSIEAGNVDLKLAGRLWNCTDILPASYCADLDLPSGSTYAQAARDYIRFVKRKQRSKRECQ